MASKIRIESHEDVVSYAKVWYIAEDGTETEISRAICGIHWYVGEVGGVSRATLDVLLVDADLGAAEAIMTIRELIPPSRWTRAGQRVRHWLGRVGIDVGKRNDVADVTRMRGESRSREWALGKTSKPKDIEL